MKRFNIHNKANGLKFQIERSELGELQPEWGKHEHTVQDEVLDSDGKPILDDDGKPVTQERMVPAEYEIIETDMTAEIAAAKADKESKEKDAKDRSARLASLAAELGKGGNTIAALRTAVGAVVQDLVDEIEAIKRR